MIARRLFFGWVIRGIGAAATALHAAWSGPLKKWPPLGGGKAKCLCGVRSAANGRESIVAGYMAGKPVGWLPRLEVRRRLAKGVLEHGPLVCSDGDGGEWELTLRFIREPSIWRLGWKRYRPLGAGAGGEYNWATPRNMGGLVQAVFVSELHTAVVELRFCPKCRKLAERAYAEAGVLRAVQADLEKSFWEKDGKAIDYWLEGVEQDV